MAQFERTGPFEVGGLHFHVVPEEEAASSKKHKKKGHMVLEFWRPEGWAPDGQWSAGRWIPTPMDVGFLLAEFFFQEEEFLYPRGANGWIGGDKYMRYCWDAALKGWHHAAENLEQDKAGKAVRVSRPYRGHSAAWELHSEWSAKAQQHLADDDSSDNRGDGTS